MLDNASTSESSSESLVRLFIESYSRYLRYADVSKPFAFVHAQTFDADHWQSFGEASSKSEQGGPSRPVSHFQNI